MAVICNTCGLPDDLCACGDLDKDSNHIIIRLETRRFKKKGTMIEGLDPKINNLENVAKQLKSKYACGGTSKQGYIFLLKLSRYLFKLVFKCFQSRNRFFFIAFCFC